MWRLPVLRACEGLLGLRGLHSRRDIALDAHKPRIPIRYSDVPTVPRGVHGLRQPIVFEGSLRRVLRCLGGTLCATSRWPCGEELAGRTVSLSHAAPPPGDVGVVVVRVLALPLPSSLQLALRRLAPPYFFYTSLYALGCLFQYLASLSYAVSSDPSPLSLLPQQSFCRSLVYLALHAPRSRASLPQLRFFFFVVLGFTCAWGVPLAPPRCLHLYNEAVDTHSHGPYFILLPLLEDPSMCERASA